MATITIQVSGEEFEQLNIELTSEEVSALYKLRKENSVKIAELEKEIDSAKKNKDYSDKREESLNSELGEAHTLLTALGIMDKTEHEESYYRKTLKVATRIALYIAKNK